MVNDRGFQVKFFMHTGYSLKMVIERLELDTHFRCAMTHHNGCDCHYYAHGSTCLQYLAMEHEESRPAISLLELKRTEELADNLAEKLRLTEQDNFDLFTNI